MSELEKVLDAVMKSKDDLIREEISEADRDELIASLRETMKKKIVEEVKEQYKQEIIEEANDEMTKAANRQKLKEIKSVMWNGFLLAFVVGLVVNQVTDLVGFWKGTVSAGDLGKTIILVIVLLAVCLLLYGYSFLASAISLFDDIKKDKN